MTRKESSDAQRLAQLPAEVVETIAAEQVAAEGKQLGAVCTWAERRLGELLALMSERGERQQRGGDRKTDQIKPPPPGIDPPPTVHQLLGGTPKQAEHLATRAQRLAQVPVEEVQRIVEAQVATAAQVTPARVLAQAKREAKRRAKATVEYLGARTEEGKRIGVVQTWAQHRLGELLAKMDERGERQKKGGDRRTRINLTSQEVDPEPDTPPTLKDLGITYNESSDAQLPAEVVERITAEQVATPGAATPETVVYDGEDLFRFVLQVGEERIQVGLRLR